MHAILEDAAAGKLTDPDAAKIAALRLVQWTRRRSRRWDAKPLAPYLAEIRKVKTKDQFTALMGKANASPYSSILPVGITIDAKAPTKYAVTSGTAGLGLPDRDYYLQPSFAEKKAKYELYVAQMLTLAGWEKPAENAKAIVAFETKLAEASWSRIQRRDRDKTYNPMSPAELNALTPGFDWTAISPPPACRRWNRIIVTTNTAFGPFAKIYAETPLATLQAWQAFHVADNAAPFLSKRFVDANWTFRNKELAGQPEQQARWKRAGAFMDNSIGESGPGLTSPATSRPRRRSRWTLWSATSAPP